MQTSVADMRECEKSDSKLIVIGSNVTWQIFTYFGLRETGLQLAPKLIGPVTDEIRSQVYHLVWWKKHGIN